MRLGLQDKVAIVTGSGRGIAAESAQADRERSFAVRQTRLAGPTFT